MKNEIKTILAVCAELTGSKKMISRSRLQEDVLARNVAIYLMRKFMFMGLTSIGKVMQRDHTTVLNSLRVCSNLLDIEDELFTTTYNRIKSDDRLTKILYHTDQEIKLVLPAFINREELLEHIRTKYPDCEFL